MIKEWKITRKNLTFYLHKVVDKEIVKGYWLQLSTVEPWWFPKKESILDGKVTLIGWLFFYVGYDNKNKK